MRDGVFVASRLANSWEPILGQRDAAASCVAAPVCCGSRMVPLWFRSRACHCRVFFGTRDGALDCRGRLRERNVSCCRPPLRRAPARCALSLPLSDSTCFAIAARLESVLQLRPQKRRQWNHSRFGTLTSASWWRTCKLHLAAAANKRAALALAGGSPTLWRGGPSLATHQLLRPPGTLRATVRVQNMLVAFCRDVPPWRPCVASPVEAQDPFLSHRNRVEAHVMGGPLLFGCVADEAAARVAVRCGYCRTPPGRT